MGYLRSSGRSPAEDCCSKATPCDPVVLGGVALTMVFLGLLAGWIPALLSGCNPLRFRCLQNSSKLTWERIASGPNETGPSEVLAFAADMYDSAPARTPGTGNSFVIGFVEISSFKSKNRRIACNRFASG